MSASVWALPASPFHFTLPVARIPLRGEGSLRVLHGQTTQAIEGAAPGSLIETCCVTPTARLVALAAVAVLSDGADLLVTAGSPAQVHQSLDRVLFPADRVALGEPQALLWHGLVQPGGEPGGAGWSLPGQHWLLAEGEALPEPLMAAAALSPEQQEQLRIHQGIPAPGAELREEFNPFELGLRQRVSLEKGCYLGQETMAKLVGQAGVKQQLRCWSCGSPLSTGTKLTLDGERAGVITSALEHEGTWIGLALVRRQWLASEMLEGPNGEQLRISRPEAFQDPEP